MPPKKRKASDEEEITNKTPKKSKKEQLAEARARAKQWAEEEAAKKKGTPAKAFTATTPAKPSNTTNWPVKRSPSTSPRKAPLSPKRPKVEQVSSPKKPTSERKPSNEKKRAEARARAKAWAAAEEAEKLISGTRRDLEERPSNRGRPRKEVEEEKEEDEVMDDAEEVEDDDEETEDEVPEEQVEEKPLKKQPAKVRVPFASPERPVAPKRMTASKKQAAAELLPPATMSNSRFNIQHQVKVEQVQENSQTLELEKQVQEQVIANAMAFGTPSRTSVGPQDVVAFMQQQQPPQQRQQYQYMQPEYEKKRRRPYLICVSILAVVGAVVTAVVSGNFKDVNEILPTMPSLTSRSNKLPPCFTDKGILPEEEIPSDSPFKCDKSLGQVDCPEHGRCSDGSLYVCTGMHYEMAADGSLCVLNEAANVTMAKVETMLTNWTIQNFCSFDGVEFARKSKTKAGAMFPLAKVTEQVQVENSLLLRSDAYTVVRIDDELLIGLSDDYANTRLSMPTLCWVGLYAVDTVTSVVSGSFYAAMKAASTVFSVTFAYPLASLVCLFVLLAIHYTRRRQESRKTLAADVATVRQMAYQRMMSDSLEHVVLHLRDGIAMDMHPTSKHERSYVILKVWPRVVADVRLDNRVLKTNRMAGGKPRDVWQWVATPSASGVSFEK